MTGSRGGTGRNVAPEVVDPNLEHGDGYGPEVDLWSVGVILYSMLCGFPPFYSDSNPALVKQIRTASYKFHSPYWDEVSFGAKDLVSNLLVVRPCRRFTCHQCLEHPWIKHAGDDSSRKLHRCPAGRPGPPLARHRRPPTSMRGWCTLGPPQPTPSRHPVSALRTAAAGSARQHRLGPRSRAARAQSCADHGRALI